MPGTHPLLRSVWLSGSRIRTSHPCGSRRRKPARAGSKPLAPEGAPEDLRFQIRVQVKRGHRVWLCPKGKSSTSWLTVWAHPGLSRNGSGAGPNHPRWFGTSTLAGCLPPTPRVSFQRREPGQTAPGRAARSSTPWPACGPGRDSPPRCWSVSSCGRTISWPRARSEPRSGRPR